MSPVFTFRDTPSLRVKADDVIVTAVVEPDPLKKSKKIDLPTPALR